MAERERALHILRLPGTASCYGLQATWGLGNQLYAFPGRNPLLQDGGVQAHDPEATEIHEVRWDTDMHGKLIRRLVNQSHNIFMMLQSQAAEASSATLKQQLVKCSKQYRSVMKACSMELLEASEDAADEMDVEDFQDQLKSFEMQELIWSLCEILFIDAAPGGRILIPLLEWLRRHFLYGVQIFKDVIQKEKPEEHHEYWECIYRLILQGEVEKVRSLLARHSAKQTDSFQSIEELLKKMPLYSSNNRGSSLSEFEMKWRHWRDDCERRLEEGDFATNKYLETVARILCGDNTVFSHLRDLCQTWYHMLISKLLYQNPTVKADDLQYYTQDCLDEFRSDGMLGDLDNILIAVFEFDSHQVLKECSGFFRSFWFAAHLTDLLHHGGCLKSHRLVFGSDLREFLLLDYAASLMSHKSLWQVGVHYLDHCPLFGRSYLEQYIERMSYESEKKAVKLLHICEQRNMSSQVKSICKVMGMRLLHNDRLGAALTWFLKSKDVAFATLVAEKFLTQYSDKGKFDNLDLIDNLGSSMLLSNRLTFLGKYREFHKLYEEREYHAAGHLLFSLLTSRLAPREFWITLLKDALGLLQLRELVYDRKQTCEMMHCLEELTKDTKHLEAGKQTTDLSELQENISLLQVALTKNLAKAIVTEGTVHPS
ncbi:hypothetical protein ACJMK2_034424 [Sinanodonta woodiana]|uniref:Nuclear pore complex protein Nup85 n=2 Tax=Sinanodonta woodiana TaxID=1069815 RepID=A0ABD3WRJ2_SINWO